MSLVSTIFQSKMSLNSTEQIYTGSRQLEPQPNPPLYKLIPCKTKPFPHNFIGEGSIDRDIFSSYNFKPKRVAATSTILLTIAS